MVLLKSPFLPLPPSLSGGPSAHLWDLSDTGKVSKLVGHTRDINEIHVVTVPAAEGQVTMAVTLGGDNVLRTWNLDQIAQTQAGGGGEAYCNSELRNVHRGEVRSLCVLPARLDGRARVLSFGYEQDVALWGVGADNVRVDAMLLTTGTDCRMTNGLLLDNDAILMAWGYKVCVLLSDSQSN